MEKLLDELNEDTVAAEVVMLRAALDRPIVVVEGGSDEKFLAAFIDVDAVDFVFAHGKQRALEAIKRLNSMDLKGVLCIVDRDYDDILGINNDRPNAIFVDNDVETVLFRSKALDRVLIELGSRQKIKTFADRGMDIRNHIRTSAGHIGSLRVYSARNGLGLKFKGLNYKFVSRKDVSIDIDMMLKLVLDHSKKSNLLSEVLKSEATKECDDERSGWALVCGHDLTTILAKAFHVLLGNRSTNESTKDDVESRLRIAYSRQEFLESPLFKHIDEWERDNMRYRILRADFRTEFAARPRQRVRRGPIASAS